MATRITKGKVRELTAADLGIAEARYTEDTLNLPAHDADINIVFPGGQKVILQWRVDTPSLDICFSQPVEVFNDGADMTPAPTGNQPSHHVGVEQLVIPLHQEGWE